MSETAHYREPDEAIESLEHWLYHKGKWANIWKRAAKNKLEEVQILQRAEKDYEEQLRKCYATATRRLGLLRRYNDAVAFFLAHEEEYADRDTDDWINMMRDLTNVMTDVARELADD